MGATDFYQSIVTNDSVGAAYRRLCDQAIHERGANSYNGTISTTSGVHVAIQTPMPIAEARRLAHSRMEHLDKYDCEAIPTLAATDCAVRTVSITVSVTGDLLANYDALKETLRSAAQRRCKKGEIVGELNIVKDADDCSHTAGWTTTCKTITKVGAGEAVTRYYLKDQYKRTTGLAGGYVSQAAARGAAIDIAGKSREPITITITAIKSRSSGEPLVTVQRVVTKATATFTATLIKTKPNATRAGWLFYGLASE